MKFSIQHCSLMMISLLMLVTMLVDNVDYVECNYHITERAQGFDDYFDESIIEEQETKSKRISKSIGLKLKNKEIKLNADCQCKLTLDYKTKQHKCVSYGQAAAKTTSLVKSNNGQHQRIFSLSFAKARTD